VEQRRLLQELWLYEQLPAVLLQAGHHEAVLPDGPLLPTAMCLSETELLQPMLRSSQVLCAGCLLRSGSGLCSGLCGSGCLWFPLLPGSGLRSGVCRSGCLWFSLLPGSGELLRSDSLLRSSEVLPRSFVLCSGLCAEVLPGSGELLCSVELLPGSCHLLRSVDLCSQVLCGGSGFVLRAFSPDLQQLQHLRFAQLVQLASPRQLLPELVHGSGLLQQQLRDC
jgi:hypothetical protein